MKKEEGAKEGEASSSLIQNNKRRILEIENNHDDLPSPPDLKMDSLMDKTISEV